MADQLTLHRACRLAPTAPPVPYRQRASFLEDYDHAVVPGAVWTECGAAAYDEVPLPFGVEVAPTFLRPPRCPACLAAAGQQLSTPAGGPPSANPGVGG